MASLYDLRPLIAILQIILNLYPRSLIINGYLPVAKRSYISMQMLLRILVPVLGFFRRLVPV